MSRWELGQGECGGPLYLGRFVRRRRDNAQGERQKEASISWRSLVFRSANFIALCALVFASWGSETSRAQQPDFSVYTRAVEFCRGVVKRPMALDLDKRVLCFDGQILSGQNTSLVSSLEHDGLFVVRSPGGDIVAAITLADSIRERRATVVVYDYCFSACASYLVMASTKTIVLRSTLLAWHYTSDPSWCPSLVVSKDDGPKRLEKSPCPDAPPDMQDGDKYRRYLNYRFYEGRAVDSSFDDPPESFTIRKMLRGMFEGTGRYPDVLWTWNPRYYASALKTKIVYEAYPNSQAEVDAMAAKLRLGHRVLYDP